MTAKRTRPHLCHPRRGLAARPTSARIHAAADGEGCGIVRFGVFRTADVELHYSICGSGPALLLCHALGTDSALWDAQIPALSAHFTTLSYDLPGHGRSPPCSPDNYSFEAMADIAADLLTYLGLRSVSVIGISVGGEIAQMLAARHSDRIEDLVLCSTACFTDSARRALWEERIMTVRKGGMSAIAASTVNRWFSPAFQEAQRQTVEEYRQRMARIHPDAYIGIVRSIQRLDLRPQLRDLACRCLVICGSEDSATGPSIAKDIIDRISGATLSILEKVGHLPNVETPGRFNSLLLTFLPRPAGPC